jgi:malate dehydrogenase (quinone)
MTNQVHQVAIIGGGVGGTAVLYLLAEYTALKDIVFLEN